MKLILPEDAQFRSVCPDTPRISEAFFVETYCMLLGFIMVVKVLVVCIDWGGVSIVASGAVFG